MPGTVLRASQAWLIARLSQTHLTSSEATALKADVISRTLAAGSNSGFLTRSPMFEPFYSTVPNLSDFLWSLFYLIAIVCQASELQTAPIPCLSPETLSGHSDWTVSLLLYNSLYWICSPPPSPTSYSLVSPWY